MFNSIAASEIKKIKYSRIIWALVTSFAFTAALYVFMTVVNVESLKNEGLTMVEIKQLLGQITFPSFFAALSVGPLSIITIVLVGISGSFFGKEYKTTLRQTMMVVDDRKSYYLTKVLFITVISFIFILLVGAFYVVFTGLYLGWDTLFIESLGKQLLGIFSNTIMTFGIISLFMMISTFIRGKFNGVIIYVFIGIVSAILQPVLNNYKNEILIKIMEYIPTNFVQKIVNINGLVNINEAIIGIVYGGVLLVVSTIVGIIKFRRQEL